MQKKIIILILFTLLVLGGKLLPQTPAHSGSKNFNPDGKVNSDEGTTLVKITDGLSPVIRVIDGDTIVVEVDGVQEKIRLIGVDTPEVVDPRKAVQCFGKEASTFTKNLLTNARVRLERDPSQGDRDKYGRLLRYVFLSDNTLLNKKLIAEGYGHEYTYRTPYLYQADFKDAMRLARETQKGLWGSDVCTRTP